jgi:hypothetical protein
VKRAQSTEIVEEPKKGLTEFRNYGLISYMSHRNSSQGRPGSPAGAGGRAGRAGNIPPSSSRPSFALHTSNITPFREGFATDYTDYTDRELIPTPGVSSVKSMPSVVHFFLIAAGRAVSRLPLMSHPYCSRQPARFPSKTPLREPLQ